MAESVHLFVCGSGFGGRGLFALTADRSGANLPKSDCPTGWGYSKTIEMDGEVIDGVVIDARAAAAELKKTGYHLIHVKAK
jgi:hypothetical protein